AFRPGAIGFRRLEQFTVLPTLERNIQDGQCVGAGRHVCGNVEIACLAKSTIAESRYQSALWCFPFGAMLRQILLHFIHTQWRQSNDGGSRTNRGQKLSGIFCEQENGGELWGLLEHFEQRVGGLLHESRSRENVNPFFCF